MAAEGRRWEWVLLTYWLPRTPSAPRLALWRKLRRLGVAQLTDGLVALPADARTREQLEWAADEVIAAGGSASVWFARAGSRAQEREIAREMNVARVGEYIAMIADAVAAADQPDVVRRRTLRRLRGELARIERRDYFRPPERQQARAALTDLAAATEPPTRTVPTPSATTETADA